MNKRYQVFISSTYLDLQEERREVIQALLELDCLPAGMEMFPAASDDQWTLIQEVIDESDYYVVVLGGKYGSTTKEGISYTEKEFDYAVSTGMQVLGFVPQDASLLPESKIELDPEIRQKLETFRSKVMGRLVKKYSGPDVLGAVVSRALSVAMKKHPAEGWVRARFAMTPETATEIAQLREQLAATEVKRLTSEKSTDDELSDLEQGDDTVDLLITIASQDYGDSTSVTAIAQPTWDEVFGEIGPMMIDESEEKVVRERLAVFAALWGGFPKGIQEQIEAVKNAYVHLFIDDWEGVKIQLRALGLVNQGTKKRTVTDNQKYLGLTERGERHLIFLRAARRSDSSSNLSSDQTTGLRSTDPTEPPVPQGG